MGLSVKVDFGVRRLRTLGPEGLSVRNRPVIIGLVAVVVILAGVVGFLLMKPAQDVPASVVAGGGSGASRPLGSDSVVAGSGGVGSAAKVAAVTVVQDSVGRPVRLTGNVTPIRDVTLVSKVPGTVAWTAGGMGTRVEAGDPVLRLDATELQLNVEQAAAGHAAARANLARLEAGAAEEEIAQVEAAVEQARLGLVRVAEVLKRQEELFTQGVIPEETLLGVRTEHDVARLQYESAQKQLVLVRRGASEEERQAVRAQVQQAEVAVKLAEQQLADTVIRAPFSGLLASQPAQTGMLIGAGTPIVGMVDLDQVVIEANVGEREVNGLRVGERVVVTVDALVGQPPAVRSGSGAALGNGRFTAIIDAIAPVADRQTGTFPVRFIVDNEDHELKPGMVARVEIEVGHSAPGPVVPAEAVVARGGSTFVYVPEADGIGRQVARERAVAIEASSGGLMLIRSGLRVGDTIVVAEPGTVLRDGSFIQIVREEL